MQLSSVTDLAWLISSCLPNSYLRAVLRSHLGRDCRCCAGEDRGDATQHASDTAHDRSRQAGDDANNRGCDAERRRLRRGVTIIGRAETLPFRCKEVISVSYKVNRADYARVGASTVGVSSGSSAKT
jgi:hypothetical protein